VRGRLAALASGVEESALVWGREFPIDAGDELSSESGEAEGDDYTVEHRIMTVPLDAGLDLADLERQLNEATAEQFLPVEWMLDQTLVDGRRAHVVVCVRHAVASNRDEASVAEPAE
jgi:hypothetical protein